MIAGGYAAVFNGFTGVVPSAVDFSKAQVVYAAPPLNLGFGPITTGTVVIDAFNVDALRREEGAQRWPLGVFSPSPDVLKLAAAILSRRDVLGAPNVQDHPDGLAGIRTGNDGKRGGYKMAGSPPVGGKPLPPPAAAPAVRATGVRPSRAAVTEEEMGALMVSGSLVSLQQLRRAREEAKRTGTRLGDALVKLNFLAEEALLDFLAKQYNVPKCDLGKEDIDPEAVKLVPRDMALRLKLIPVYRAGSTLIVAMADPSNVHAIDEVRFQTQYGVEPVVATEAAILAAIERSYEKPPDQFDDLLVDLEPVADEEGQAIVVADAERAANDAPIVKLVDWVMLEAVKRGASDIHIGPSHGVCRIRFRIDGFLFEARTVPIKNLQAIVNRIKIQAKLDVAERRLPQDGRIKVKLGTGGRVMEFRVSIIPSLNGENVVMRILDSSALQLDMTRLGFDPDELAKFEVAVRMPYGMVLVTGPTGSGKTTTLYSALAALNDPARNILTVEDPVEFEMPGIVQVNVNEKAGMKFDGALRAFLRHDPDVVMVGEIRDFETADIAVKAALTGHMVLSTVHTNDAPSAVGRLLSLGVEPFLLAGSLKLILAQRLCRRVCESCKTEVAPDVPLLIGLGMRADEAKRAKAHKGTGCPTCNNSGYKGRVALYEVMPISPSIMELILNGASPAELQAEAVRLGMRTLRQAGLRKILDGVTTPEEVMRVTIE